MTDYSVEKRERDIENGFVEYPWLVNFLQKNMLDRFLREEDPKRDFFLSRIDSSSATEVMFFLDQNGAYLGEMNEIEMPTNVFSFCLRNETVLEALLRISGEPFYILKNRNYTHAILYKTLDKKSLREYAQELVRKC